MQCPSCGSGIEADERFAHFYVCPYCQGASVLDEKAASLAGKMSVLARTSSPLFTGATGTLSGRGLRVLGRVRYGYEQGFWDEWYVALEDGSTAWISDDESDLTFERLTEEEAGLLSFTDVRPGDEVKVGGRFYRVKEKGVARCEGGEGQLPFPVVAGEDVPFVDLEGDGVFATVELGDDGGVRLFRGRPIATGDLVMDTGRAGAADSLEAEREAGEAGRARVVKTAARTRAISCESCGFDLGVPEAGASVMTCSACGSEVDLALERIDCKSCGASIPRHGGEDAHSVVCPSCRTQLSCRRGVVEVLARHAELERPPIPFKLGQPCTFDGKRYRVAGHLHFREYDEGSVYVTDELLLYSKEGGYRWLGLESGHFTLWEELRKQPSVDARSVGRGTKFDSEGRRWTGFESGRTCLEWVDGELPWVAEVGDVYHYMDATSPPHLLSAEWTEKEIDWSLGRYLESDAVAAAFGVPLKSLPPPLGVAPHQPYHMGGFARSSSKLMVPFIVVFLALTVWASLSGGRKAATFTLTPAQYRDEYVTEPFTIEQSESLCAARFFANANNSWVYLNVAVINERDEVIHEFTANMSYYSGVEGGERWSEGSRKDSVSFKLEDPGTYRLLVQGEAGTGEVADAGIVDQRATVSIEVREGIVLIRYFVLGAVLSLAWVLAVWLPRWIFEMRRWKSDE